MCKVPDLTKTINYPKDFFWPNTLSDIDLTREDIIDAIKTISQNSAWGPDEFPVLLLTQCSKILAQVLQLVASPNTRETPLDLKRVIITPIYKGGSRNFLKACRPIALKSHLIRILEKILPKKIHQFLETNQKMNPMQRGFRSGRSCLLPSSWSSTTRY